jgi:hypothetical protein
MCLYLVSLEIHLRLEYHEFLLQTLLVEAHKVVPLKVVFKGIIIDIVLLLAVGTASVTNVTAFVTLPTVGVKLIIAIESLAAEATLRVSLKSTLVDRAWSVVAVLFVFAQFVSREEDMLVGEHFFVPRAKVTRNIAISQLVGNNRVV